MPSTRRKLLAQRYFGLVWTIASQVKSRVPASIELDDLVGDGALGLLYAAAKFQPRKNVPFRSFAARCIRSAIIDGLRRASGRGNAPGPSRTPRARACLCELVAVDSQLERVDQSDLLDSILRALPFRTERTLRLYFLQERRMKQVARILGVSEARVSQLVAQGVRAAARTEPARRAAA